jgi:hypothetical protein
VTLQEAPAVEWCPAMPAAAVLHSSSPILEPAAATAPLGSRLEVTALAAVQRWLAVAVSRAAVARPASC